MSISVRWVFFAVLVLVSVPQLPYAHGSVLEHQGGLDKQGCHVDRKNGLCHCHKDPDQVCKPPSNEQGNSVR